MKEAWKGWKPAAIEVFHGEAMEQFHKGSEFPINETWKDGTRFVNGIVVNTILAAFKTKIMKEYGISSQPIKENEMEDKAKETKVKPSIGRIVHYMKYGSPGGEHKPEPSPAVITKVEDDGETCHLFVMNQTGCYFNKTHYSQEPKPGHWSWPTFSK